MWVLLVGGWGSANRTQTDSDGGLAYGSLVGGRARGSLALAGLGPSYARARGSLAPGLAAASLARPPCSERAASSVPTHMVRCTLGKRADLRPLSKVQVIPGLLNMA
jgi:hypothetical protein